MTALIDRIDPNAHPKLWFGVLIMQRIGIPVLLTACYCVVIILGGTMMVDALQSIDADTLTPNEENLYHAFLGGFLLLTMLCMMRRMRH